MPVIVFASPKGGVGKTTSSFLLATELAAQGVDVTVIDADPNRPFATWQERGGRTDHLHIHVNTHEEAILDDINAASQRSRFVIVDLEGTANLSVAYAISTADLVIIPLQRSTLDAGEAARAVALVKRQSSVTRRHIPVSLLLTRTSQAIRPKALKKMMDNLEQHHIRSFVTELHEREAFKAVFDHAKTLAQLMPSQISTLEKARANAHQFAEEVVDYLVSLKQSQQRTEAQA